MASLFKNIWQKPKNVFKDNWAVQKPREQKHKNNICLVEVSTTLRT